jgi:hypothetical protein
MLMSDMNEALRPPPNKIKMNLGCGARMYANYSRSGEPLLNSLLCGRKFEMKGEFSFPL